MFNPVFPNGFHATSAKLYIKHQMLIILTNPTSDIWILRLTKQTCWRDFGNTAILRRSKKGSKRQHLYITRPRGSTPGDVLFDSEPHIGNIIYKCFSSLQPIPYHRRCDQGDAAHGCHADCTRSDCATLCAADVLWTCSLECSSY